MDDAYVRLCETDPSRRVLLLSHCMRPSQTCPGKFGKQGLVCPDDCDQDCVIGRLRRAALALGYEDVCVAAGGKMALRFVKEHNPLGIVAVACHKELLEGLEGVQELGESTPNPPVVVGVPLTQDGCVDTRVDETQALEAIALGCNMVMAQGNPAELC
ncbi:MAG: DUF116 domain-containing protein [Anaerolineae bacterium]